MYGDIAGTVFIIFWLGFMYHMLHPYVKAAMYTAEASFRPCSASASNGV